MAFHKKTTGDHGEELATDLLRSEGYTILERNYRFGKAEIDIIARIGDEVIFVEVKTHRNFSDVLPDDLLTPKQIGMITNAADEYIRSRDLDVESRFDLICVDPGQSPPGVNHIECAFYPFDGM
jgi:putative endonuclease